MEQINAAFVEQEEQLKMQKDITSLLEKLKKDTELMSDQEFQNLFGVSVKRAQMGQLVEQVQQVKLQQTDRLMVFDCTVSGGCRGLGERQIRSYFASSEQPYRHELYDVTAITEDECPRKVISVEA